MNRLGSSVLTGVPLLSLDEMLAAIDAVTAEDVAALAARAVRARAAVGRRRGRRRGRLPRARSSRSNPRWRRRRDQRRRLRRRRADGADGRAPPSRAPTTWRWSGRADPQLDAALQDVLGDADVVVDFSHARHRARQRARSASRPACTA